MGVTYTTAAQRRARTHRRLAIATPGLHLPLGVVSVLAVVLLLAACLGRFASAPGAANAVRLTEVQDARALEPVLTPLFETAADASLAARELFAFLVQADGGDRDLPNVGRLARARVPGAAIDAAPGATSYRSRLEDARAAAARAGRPAPESLSLLTSSQLAQLKPHVIVRGTSDVVGALVLWGLLYVLAFHGVAVVWRARGLHGYESLLVITHLLTAVGFAMMVSRPDPLRDVLLFERFAQGVAIGLLLAAAVPLVGLTRPGLAHFSYLPLLGAILLSVVLILFGSGPSGSNAKVNLGPVQPIEAIRLLLALFLAGYFARNWEVLRAVREHELAGVALPAWLHVPRVRYVVPVLIGVGAALALFFFQRDLGPALMLALVFLATWGIAHGRIGLVAAGTVLLCAGFYAGYLLEISSTLNARVAIWQSPWDNAARGGDQVAHALWASATGGVLGAGLGLGDPRYVPAGETDLVLAAVGEELGAFGLCCVALLFAALVWKSLRIGLRAATDYGFFLALVLGLFFAVPVLLVTAGMLGLLPLTGVVTPFVSFGGSAMVANFVAIGLLVAIRAEGERSADLAVFRPALRWASRGLAAAAILLVVAALRVQVVQADEIAIRPHLGLQADGSRRYQYNPRVLDAARLIPRGSIVDRNGLPLATDDRDRLSRAAAAFEKAGVAWRRACADPAARCYPLGGAAFHVIGDANRRLNWAAGNSSFVERDHEAQLRGFDDHQTSVRLDDDPGAWTVRRDYRELLPILRHRRDPGHDAVEAMLARAREVTLTIDARLQAQVGAILARHALKSTSGRAAAVVLDPATGDLLASVSYPWPSGESGAVEMAALLDRARYGLYPPGSTFKLVTAAAGLLGTPPASARTFTCTRLGDGRVGTRIKGWNRPIRDDVLDKEPHGTVDLHKGIVVSCNAYFAQLAMEVGPDRLLEAATRAGVSLAPGDNRERIRATLPQAGYGQGDVLASPLRMARVAAAIAGDGVIREVRIDRSAPVDKGHEFLPAPAARLLGSYMRDAVLSGSGRSLRGEATPIAGKTGTAEVGGAASHAWFIGFAPHGPATSRIAVAVLVENAGYGGRAAAPIAGEIVKAAAQLGLAR